MDEQVLRTLLDRISIRLAANERYIASIPGASKVEVEPLKASLRAELTEPLKNVQLETRHRWSDLHIDRIFALANGKEPPKEADPA